MRSWLQLWIPDIFHFFRIQNYIFCIRSSYFKISYFLQNTTGVRRYEWIKYRNGPSYGHTDRKCVFADSWVDGYRKYLLWRCMYCFCLCDEESSVSDRFFSLVPSAADIENNMQVDTRNSPDYSSTNVFENNMG